MFILFSGKMERIEKIGTRYCRHCSQYSEDSFAGLWGAFFEGVDDTLFDRGMFMFDHISHHKFWFITEPYLHTKNPETDPDVKKLDEWLTKNGATLFYVNPGYHGRGGVTTMIIVPSNLVKFKERVNQVLDTKSRYDAWIDAGAPHTFSFDKSYARNVIRNYFPPSARECMISAMAYLTWMDRIDRKYPYNESKEEKEKIKSAWHKLLSMEIDRTLDKMFRVI